VLRRLAALARDVGIDAYVVGGTVRDALLDRPVRDVDLAVSGDALAWARSVADALDSSFVELDDERAVARVVLRERAGDVAYVDIAALQGSLHDDLRRRDFTADALAVPIDGAEVIDIVGGLRDIDARLLRMNGPDVFDADPLRLLRGVRIASELALEIEPATTDEMRRRAPALDRAAAERRRDELMRILALDRAYEGVRLLDGMALLDVLFPELALGRGVAQPEKFHAYDVFEHNLRAVDALDAMLGAVPGDPPWLREEVWASFGWCERELRDYFAEEMGDGHTRAALLKLTALLHDVAKPQTRRAGDDGRIRFFGHSELGAAIARRRLQALRFSSRETQFVTRLIEEHLRPVQLAPVGERPTRRALYRFYKALGDAVPAVLFLALADAAAARGPWLTREGWAAQARYMAGLLVRSQEEEGIVHPPRLLTGHDIIRELRLAEGPVIGRLLAALEEAQAAGEVEDRAGALAFVRGRAEEELGGTGEGR
jgi:putative nucleotidyltransferase with HDIG domain